MVLALVLLVTAAYVHFAKVYYASTKVYYASTDNDLCVVAIFKNEGHILREWLDHYRKEGVSKFFLINNGSDDDGWKQATADANDVQVVLLPEKHMQTVHYNRILSCAKKFKWVMVVDLDEFVYARGAHRTIPSFLRTLSPEIDQVLIGWTMFGSNGHDVQPKSVINSFTRRYHHKDSPSYFSNPKYIARTEFILELGVHSAKTIRGTVHKIAPASLTEPLRLNHYAIQSKEFFRNVKMKRGDASVLKNELVRTWNYFDKYDVNHILDTELREKRRSS